MDSDSSTHQSPPDFQALYTKMSQFVNTCMANHDPSHNPPHVHRVVALAKQILASEQSLHPNQTYNTEVVHLAALLHDIGDRKYLHNLEAAGVSTSGTSSASGSDIDPKTMVQHALIQHGTPEDLASRVQKIVSHVSYSTEIKDPSLIRRLIDEEGIVELAIVQDADRLDAIGAIGIGRTFTFLGAQGKKFVGEGGKWDMSNCIEHFGDKLELLEGMMKTKTGREMARVRTERLKVFRGWWEEEMGIHQTGTVAGVLS